MLNQLLNWYYQQLAKKEIQQENWKTAIHFLQKCLKQVPKNRKTIQLMVNALTQLQDYSSAIQILDNYTQNQPDPEALCTAGEIAIELRNLKLAENYFDKALKIGPHNRIAQLGKARCWFAAAEYDKALPLLNALLVESPNWPEALLLRANLHLRAKKYPDALADFTSFSTTNPLDNRAIAGQINAYAGLKQWYLANKLTDRLLEIEPQNENYTLLKIKIQREQGLLKEAVETSNKLLLVNPASAECYFELGLVWILAKNFAEAGRSFNKVIALEPKNGLAWAHRAFTKVFTSRLPEAIRDLDKAEQLLGSHPLIYRNRGLVYLTTGDHETAQNWFNRCLQLEPTFEWTNYYLGLSLVAKGQLEAGKKALQFAYDQGEKDAGKKLLELGLEEVS